MMLNALDHIVELLIRGTTAEGHATDNDYENNDQEYADGAAAG